MQRAAAGNCGRLNQDPHSCILHFAGGTIFPGCLSYRPDRCRRLRSLYSGRGAITILSMSLSRSLRRFVAVIAAALFLACQGMAVSRAASLAFPESSAGAAQASCRDARWDADKNTGGDVRQSQCQSQNASSVLSKANVFTTTDLPAITIRFDSFVTAVDAAPPVVPPLARIESPPLAIVLCRLRN